MKPYNTLLPVLALSCLAAPSYATEAEQDLAAQVAKLSEQVAELQKQTDSPAISFSGRVQLDYNWFNGAYNANENGSSGSDLFPRRVRAAIDSEFENWDHTLLLEFAEGTAETIMARVRYSGFDNGLRLQFGKLREDISLNALTSSNNISLIERSSLADTFSPYFRWGASAYQYNKDNGLRWALGVYKNDAFGSDGEDDSGKLALAYTGRLTWSKTAADQVWHLGAWHSQRDMAGNELAARVARGELRETAVRLVDYAAGGDVVTLDSLRQSGLELAYQLRSLTVEAEYALRTLNTVDNASLLDGTDHSGYYLNVSFFPGGQQRPYNAGSAVFGQPKDIRNAWELVARASRLNTANAGQGTDVTTYTLGGAYYLNPKVKFMANLMHSSVSGAGQQALSGEEDSGTGFAARVQYLF